MTLTRNLRGGSAPQAAAVVASERSAVQGSAPPRHGGLCLSWQPHPNACCNAKGDHEGDGAAGQESASQVWLLCCCVV